MAIPDWFDLMAGGASIVGLGYAWWASRQATGAKAAAEAARRAVYHRNAADEVARLTRIAEGILTAIESEQYSLASYHSRDFIALAPRIRQDHDSWLGANGVKLEVAIGLAREIAQHLLTGVGQSDLEGARRVVVEMSSLEGVLRRNVREGR